VAVAQEEEQSSPNRKFGQFDYLLPWTTCQRVVGQDTEPQVASYASATDVGLF